MFRSGGRSGKGPADALAEIAELPEGAPGPLLLCADTWEGVPLTITCSHLESGMQTDAGHMRRAVRQICSGESAWFANFADA